MLLIRFMLMAFNAAVFAYLIFRIFQIYQTDTPNKGWKIGIAVLLLLLPVLMIIGILRPSFVYLLIYPVAIVLHLYLIRNS